MIIIFLYFPRADKTRETQLIGFLLWCLASLQIPHNFLSHFPSQSTQLQRHLHAPFFISLLATRHAIATFYLLMIETILAAMPHAFKASDTSRDMTLIFIKSFEIMLRYATLEYTRWPSFSSKLAQYSNFFILTYSLIILGIPRHQSPRKNFVIQLALCV